MLLVIPARIGGKIFRAFVDSGATRCFVTAEFCVVMGLSCVHHGTFLELGNDQKALSRSMVKDAPITLAGLTTKTNISVSNLLHDVDIVLGVNWLNHVNPLIDWCSGRVQIFDAIHKACLRGTWLSNEHVIGTVKVLSNSSGIKKLKEGNSRSCGQQ